VLRIREPLVNMPHRLFGVRKLQLGSLERRLPGVEIPLPLRQLIGELRIRARQRGKLQHQRVEAARS
jgi:hypothetical protein